jgi:hypothetical protein
MHRVGTGLLVAAVLGVGVAAAIDALPDDERGPAGTNRVVPQPAAVKVLREAGARGVITYSDRGCRLRALRLPSLRAASAPTIESCEPHVPSGGIGTWKGDVVWSGFGYQTVQVVLSKEEIGRAIRSRLGLRAGRFRARQAVGLAGGRYAVLVESTDRRRWQLVAGFAARRLSFVYPGGDVIRPSPLGGYFAVLDPGRGGLSVYTSEGVLLSLPDLGEPHAIAWSPDERWTALATRASIYLFPTRRPQPPVVRIVAAARDLDWGA